MDNNEPVAVAQTFIKEIAALDGYTNVVFRGISEHNGNKLLDFVGKREGSPDQVAIPNYPNSWDAILPVVRRCLPVESVPLEFVLTVFQGSPLDLCVHLLERVGKLESVIKASEDLGLLDE